MIRHTLFAAALCAAFAVQAADKPADKSTAGDCPDVKLTTSMGDITIALDRAKAPVTVDNFVGYVKSGQYDGTIFHRVINGFMIQGGGFTRDMQQKPTKAPIRNEASNGLHNSPYTIAMARTADPNSATAQFFINVVDNSKLDYQSDMNPGYAVFGKVVSGQDVVDRIKAVPTGNMNMYQNVPVQPVVIEKAVCAGRAR